MMNSKLRIINLIFFCSDIFVGQLKSELRFKDCGHKSTTFDPFWDLSVPIPKVILVSDFSIIYAIDKINKCQSFSCNLLQSIH